MVMFMKKLISIVLAAVLCISLSSCGGRRYPNENEQEWYDKGFEDGLSVAGDEMYDEGYEDGYWQGYRQAYKDYQKGQLDDEEPNDR